MKQWRHIKAGWYRHLYWDVIKDIEGWYVMFYCSWRPDKSGFKTAKAAIAWADGDHY